MTQYLVTLHEHVRNDGLEERVLRAESFSVIRRDPDMNTVVLKGPPDALDTLKRHPFIQWVEVML